MEKLLAGYRVVLAKSALYCMTIPKELTYNRTFKAKNTHHTHTFGYIPEKEGSSFPVCFRLFKTRKTKLNARGTHTPTHGLVSTLRMRTAVFETRVRPFNDPTAMPCWWALVRAKQLSTAATARVIWLCACVRYWPGRGLLYVCPLF